MSDGECSRSGLAELMVGRSAVALGVADEALHVLLHLGDEGIDFLWFAFDFQLNPTIGQVLHPACDGKASRDLDGVVPEADPLDMP